MVSNTTPSEGSGESGGGVAPLGGHKQSGYQAIAGEQFVVKQGVNKGMISAKQCVS